MPVGRVFGLGEVGRDHFLNSAFHNEFWRRSGLGAERAAVNLARGDGAFACCVLQTAPQRDRVGRKTVDHLRHLAPHLIRAVSIRRRHRELAQAAALAGVATGQRGTAAILVDRGRRLLHADAGGELALARAVSAGGAGIVSVGPIRLRGCDASSGRLEILPLAPGLLPADVFAPQPAAILLLSPDMPASQASRPSRRAGGQLFDDVCADIRANLAAPDLSLDWLARDACHDCEFGDTSMIAELRSISALVV